MLLFCVKTIVKESLNFELACLKKKKERKDFGRLAISGSILLGCFFEDEWYIDIKECIVIYCVSALSLHIHFKERTMDVRLWSPQLHLSASSTAVVKDCAHKSSLL